MKRLEAFCWTDIALLKDKKLLVLICDTPEHAKQLLGRAHIRGYKFRYKSEADHFQITLFIHGLGNISIAIGPEHPAFPLAKTFETDFVNFTTGVQFPGTQLAYLKEKYTINLSSTLKCMAMARKDLLSTGILMPTRFCVSDCSACLSGRQGNPFCPSSGAKRL